MVVLAAFFIGLSKFDHIVAKICISLFRIPRLSQRQSWWHSGVPIIEPALPVLTEVVSAASPGVQDQSLALECMITEHGIGESNTGALVALTLIKAEDITFQIIK